MNLWRWLVAKWWLVYSIGILSAVVFALAIFIIPPRPSYQAEVINYFRVYLNVDLVSLVWYPALPLMAGIILYVLKSRDSVRSIIFLVATLILYVFWLALLGPRVGRIYPDTQLSHVANVGGPEGCCYALAAYSNPYYPGDLGSYNLYDCENFPFECHLVYDRSLDMQESYLIGVKNDPDFQPHLEADETGVKFFLGDELLYSEPW